MFAGLYHVLGLEIGTNKWTTYPYLCYLSLVVVLVSFIISACGIIFPVQPVRCPKFLIPVNVYVIPPHHAFRTLNLIHFSTTHTYTYILFKLIELCIHIIFLLFLFHVLSLFHRSALSVVIGSFGGGGKLDLFELIAPFKIYTLIAHHCHIIVSIIIFYILAVFYWNNSLFLSEKRKTILSFLFWSPFLCSDKILLWSGYWLLDAVCRSVCDYPRQRCHAIFRTCCKNAKLSVDILGWHLHDTYQSILTRTR